MKDQFTEDDKNKFIEFLNFIHERAVFPNWKTSDSIKHFKLLACMQQVILPKIENHILEFKKVIKITKSVNTKENK